MSLVAAHQHSTKLNAGASGQLARGQWFWSSTTISWPPNAGENSMYFVFAGPIGPHLVKGYMLGRRAVPTRISASCGQSVLVPQTF